MRDLTKAIAARITVTRKNDGSILLHERPHRFRVVQGQIRCGVRDGDPASTPAERQGADGPVRVWVNGRSRVLGRFTRKFLAGNVLEKGVISVRFGRRVEPGQAGATAQIFHISGSSGRIYDRQRCLYSHSMFSLDIVSLIERMWLDYRFASLTGLDLNL